MTDEKPKSGMVRKGFAMLGGVIGTGAALLLFFILVPVLILLFAFTPLNRIMLPYVMFTNFVEDISGPTHEERAAAYIEDLMLDLQNGEPLPDDLPPRLADIIRVGRAVNANNNMVGDAWVYVDLAGGVQANVVFEFNRGRVDQIYLREYEQPFSGFTDRGRARLGANTGTIAVGGGDRWRFYPADLRAFSIEVRPDNPAQTREILDLTANNELYVELKVTEIGGEQRDWYRDTRTSRSDLSIDRIEVGPDTEHFTIELKTLGNMLGGGYTLVIDR